MPPKVSLIIVHYRATAELLNCLKSLLPHPTKVSLEIIIVDNHARSTLKRKLAQRFPRMRYVKSPRNLGFGAGCNLGAAKARGEYLFFLNPDTLVLPSAIDTLSRFLDTHPQAAVAAPTLLDRQMKPYPLQGTAELTPLAAVFALSFINKLWPYNPISLNYWLLNENRRQPLRVNVVPGTALMIRREIFNHVGGFDPHFFLYFEEADLCRRLEVLNYYLYILPRARVVHLWGQSTKYLSQHQRLRIFAASRWYYFRKHFGVASAVLVHVITSLNLLHLFLGLILGLALVAYVKLGVNHD